MSISSLKNKALTLLPGPVLLLSSGKFPIKYGCDLVA